MATLSLNLTSWDSGATTMTLVNGVWTLSDTPLSLFVAPQPRFLLNLTTTKVIVAQVVDDNTGIKLDLCFMPQDQNYLKFTLSRQYADTNSVVVTLHSPYNQTVNAAAGPGERVYAGLDPRGS